MTLIYYRDGNGKIIRYHLPPKELSPERLAEEMERFNATGDAKVYTHEIKEDSLEMFLYEKAQYHKRYPKEIIQAALDAIEEARDAINCLELEG